MVNINFLNVSFFSITILSILHFGFKIINYIFKTSLGNDFFFVEENEEFQEKELELELDKNTSSKKIVGKFKICNDNENKNTLKEIKNYTSYKSYDKIISFNDTKKIIDYIKNTDNIKNNDEYLEKINEYVNLILKKNIEKILEKKTSEILYNKINVTKNMDEINNEFLEFKRNKNIIEFNKTE